METRALFKNMTRELIEFCKEISFLAGRTLKSENSVKEITSYASSSPKLGLGFSGSCGDAEIVNVTVSDIHNFSVSLRILPTDIHYRIPSY